MDAVDVEERDAVHDSGERGVSAFPEMFQIGAESHIVKCSPREIQDWDGDPRGILWMWEPPQNYYTYVQAIDPSVGITGWNRFGRVAADSHTNNSAIEVVRVGKGTVKDCGCSHCRMSAETDPTAPMPDHQVAEWAGPVDAFECGEIANMIGRMYAGTEEDQCKTIGECYPGPGKMTLQRMMELGYTNHWRWERFADGPAEATHAFWWWASAANNRDLWFKASRYLCTRGLVVRSPWATDELANLRYNPEKQWAEDHNGADDRVRAICLALWAARGWSTNIERTSEPVRKNTAPDWAATDMTMDEIHDEWNRQVDAMMEG